MLKVCSIIWLFLSIRPYITVLFNEDQKTNTLKENMLWRDWTAFLNFINDSTLNIENISEDLCIQD